MSEKRKRLIPRRLDEIVKRKYYFIVCGIHETCIADVIGQKVTIRLKWAKGMVGCLPAFESQEEADNYADGKFEVMRVEAA